MAYLYSDRNREEYEKKLEAMGIDTKELNKVDPPNISVQHYRNTTGFRYTIKVNNANYICCGYDEIKLTIPAPTALTTLGKVWNGIAVTVDIATMLLGEDPFLPPASTECDTCEITITRLLDDSNTRVVDIISTEDKGKLTLAMKRSKSQCNELHGDGTIGMQILNDYYNNNSTVAISVDELYSVTNQFSEQDKKQKCKIAAEQAEKEARRKAEAERQRAEREAKQKAEAEARALRRQAFLDDIKMRKAIHRVEIKTDFYKSGLLCQTSLSNSEKLKAYSDIRDFCCKYIPVLAERGFKIETLHADYSDYISADACNAFKENWIRVSRSYSVLSRGASGEEKVYEVLRLFDDRIRILKSYVSESIDYRSKRYEHDFIVITPYGISTIEVKNLRGNYVLTETGVLKCLSSDKVQPKDVALQSKKHLETLRRNLNGCSAFSANVPLQEIICSAESNFTIRDNYHYIPVCYYNTVDKALLPEAGKVVLSEEDMDEIQKYLLDNKREAFRFDVFLPRGEIDGRELFIESFADVASGYMTAQITQQ